MEKILLEVNKYNEIHKIALDYSKGKKDNSQKIIDWFEPFINKYMLFLTNTEYTLNDYSIRNFIGLYNSNIKRYINQFKTKPTIKAIAYETVEQIHYLLSDYEEQELYNECIISLLEMASKYKDTKPSFHMYVKKCFHYYLKANLDKYTKKYMFNNSIEEYDIESILYVNEECEYGHSLDKVSKEELYNKNYINVDEYYDTHSDEHITSYNWELGITCSDVFRDLTNFERSLIIQSYLLNKNDIEIAQDYGLVRETINRKKKFAISKIKYNTGVE